MDGVIVKQLEKALNCKDDKELRLRVEVLVDMLKESQLIPAPMSVPMSVPNQPATPLQPYFDRTPALQPPYQITSSAKKKKGPQGAGAIMSPNGEQLNYIRPPHT